MVHFADINQAPSPDSMFQDVGRVATPKLVPRNCLRYLQTTLLANSNVAGYWKSSNTEACAQKLPQILANNIDHGGGLVSVLYSKLGVFKTLLFFKPHKKQQN